MSNEWRMVPKESWREETKIYHSRLERASSLSSEVGDTIKNKYPGKYWSSQPDDETTSVAIKIVIYAVTGFSYSLALRPIIEQQFKSGQFMIVPLNVRFFFEMWGGVHYAKSLLEKLSGKESVESEFKKVNKLLMGARSEVMLPWGGLATEPSIHIMDFIRSIEKDYKGSEELYNFLCEASHPNFVQNTYFQMAGPPVSNWDNVKFNEHGHKLLEKTLASYELAAYGSERDIIGALCLGDKLVNEN